MKNKIVFCAVIQFLLLVGCKDSGFKFNKNGIYAAFLNEKYNQIYAANGNNQLLVLNNQLELMQKIDLPTEHNSASICVVDMRVAPNNELLMNSSCDGSVFVWQVTENGLQQKFSDKLHVGSASNCAISQSGKLGVSTGIDSTIIIRDLENGELVKQMKSDYGIVRMVWFTYDDKLLYWTDAGGYIHITDLDNLEHKTHKLSEHPINCLVSNLDNSKIAFADEAGMVRVYETGQMKRQHVFQAHEGPAFVAAFWDLDRTKIATIGADGDIRLWKLMDGSYEMENEVQAHEGFACTLFYNQASTQVISGGQDGVVKLWTVPALELIQEKNIVQYYE